MVSAIDSSVLLGYYQTRTGQGSTTAASSSSSSSATKKYAPTAPWSTTSSAPKSPELVKSALLGKPLIDENAAKLDLAGASEDYRKLFALYQGLNTLYGLADKADDKGTSSLDLLRLKTVFAKGLKEVTEYADAQKFAQLRMTRGDAMTSDKGEVGVQKNQYDYTTRALYSGSSTDEVPAFQGNVQFTLRVKKSGQDIDMAIDLSDLGAQPRTMANVVNYINGKLAAADVMTRFATARTAGEEKTVQAGGKTITLPATADSWALKVKGVLGETVSFVPATSAPAVYVTTRAGDPDPDDDVKTDDAVIQNRLVKIDTAGTAGGAAGSRIFSDDLEGTIDTVRQTKVGADGSVYMLADVATSIDGQTVKGEKDVALLKYDGAGNLIFARTLGASDEASGLALSVASDGRVAIAGAVTGGLQGAANGATNSSAASGNTDSFVTLYDAKGDEVWTQRRGAVGADEATAVAFGDDGVVYVAGRTKGGIGGQTSSGGWDNYLSAVAADSTGKPKTLFTQQFGSAGDDKVSGLAVNNGQVVVAATEDGHGVLRSFDVVNTITSTKRDTDAAGNWTSTVTTTTGGAVTGTVVTTGTQPATGTASSRTTSYTSGSAATAGAVRDLGDLQGGSLAGIVLDGGQLYVAGSTRNAALGVNGQTLAYTGGSDAFAARLSTDLTSQASDSLAYFGGTGNDTVTGMDAAGGKVWLAGLAGDQIPAGAAIGKQDGYLAQIDLAAGVVDNAQRLTGKDGIATVTSVAVSKAGASAIEQLGFTAGALEYARSTNLVSSTSARAGDTFQIRTSEGGNLATVTLEAKDTLDTLAAKIRRAAGFKAKVEVVTKDDSRVLKISPANDSYSVEVLAGKSGADLLSALGLKEGVVRATSINDAGKTVSADGNGNVYGLNLSGALNLSSTDSIKAAQQAISKALSKIRTAYSDLVDAAKPQTAGTASGHGKTNGTVPTYLSNQVANYQAALDRLTGGG